MTDENWQIVLVSFCEALGVRARPRAAFGSQHRNVQKGMRRRIALNSESFRESSTACEIQATPPSCPPQ